MDLETKIRQILLNGGVRKVYLDITFTAIMKAIEEKKTFEWNGKLYYKTILSRERLQAQFLLSRKS